MNIFASLKSPKQNDIEEQDNQIPLLESENIGRAATIPEEYDFYKIPPGYFQFFI